MQNDKEYKRLSPEEILQKIEKMKKGRLKIYIGAAPGVGKTFHMLRDAHDHKAKGVDIVVGLIETHGRATTAAEIKDLDIIAKQTIHYKGKELQELDVEAIIKRNPDVVIVDELAHTNVPGSKNKKRYEDIHEILEAGIHVWTAMNIQHLESVRDIVQQITGIQVNERVPDSMLREADEVEIVDVSPETLRDRIQEGNVYSKDKIQQSLNNFFRRGNLVALRELSLREIADDIDLRLEKERMESGIEEPSGIHEKILVCIQYGPNAEKLIRRGARIANRLNAELYILHIRSHKSNPKTIQEWKQLAEQFGASFIVQKAKSRKVAQQMVEVCRQHKITQIIMGMSARTRWEEIWKGSIINVIMQQLQYVDVLIVSDR
ncbi:KdpD-like non-kinase potassium sensor [Baia soyae]|uniref:Two-component system sensor histidine kinase KdpD n=1 Tax=Baia soyae TaxID=1544746 RepID=A0A4V2SYI7_9BACL|nr:KdpD-like non-kinase potassium sensor [Baia soyae]TCP70721.1 two-component system sensor histidine kinase KdpD [Baia soyae]